MNSRRSHSLRCRKGAAGGNWGGSKGGKNRKPLLACKALYLLTFLKMGGKRGSIYSFGLKNKKIYNKYKITFLLPLLPPNAGTPCKCVVFGGHF